MSKSYLSDLSESAQTVVNEYHEDQDKSLPWSMDFGRVYTEVGNTISHDNNVIHVSAMLTLVSRALKKTKIQHGNRQVPPVVHTLAIQKSGTGKSPALSFARMVGEMAGYDVRMRGDLTSAGLIGGVRDGDVHPGIAKSHDIIGFDEASILFRIAQGEHSANFAEHLNNILDGRKVTKDLASGNIDYEPKCALTGITYPPDDIDYQRFMNNGTLSRFFIFYRPIDLDFYRSTSRKILRGARNVDPDVDPEESLAEIQRLGTVIKAIRMHYEPEFVFDHQFGDETEDEIIETIYGTLEEYPDDVQELVEPDLNRMVENTLKLSAVFAALDYCSEVVTDDHMKSALNIVERSWTQSLDFFEMHYQSNEAETDPALKDAESKMLRALYPDAPKTQEEVADEINRSQRMVREYAETLKELELIEETKIDRKTAYEIREL
jgi:hypothetical protein